MGGGIDQGAAALVLGRASGIAIGGSCDPKIGPRIGQTGPCVCSISMSIIRMNMTTIMMVIRVMIVLVIKQHADGDHCSAGRSILITFRP